VVVLQNGSIIEAGSHAHLYQQNGVYRNLFDTQFRDGGVLMDVKEEALPA
jgi:ABC-type multidrug transport system fused ATPase/permease subunit